MSIESKNLVNINEIILYEESTNYTLQFIAIAFTLSFIAHSAFAMLLNNFQEISPKELSEQFLSVELVSAAKSDGQKSEKANQNIQEIKTSHKSSQASTSEIENKIQQNAVANAEVAKQSKNLEIPIDNQSNEKSKNEEFSSKYNKTIALNSSRYKVASVNNTAKSQSSQNGSESGKKINETEQHIDSSLTLEKNLNHHQKEIKTAVYKSTNYGIGNSIAEAVSNNPKPKYPYIARRRGLEGELILNVEVLPSGYSGEINIYKSSGHRILDKAAVTAVKKWKFISAKNNGININSTIEIPVRFVLNDYE